MLEMNVNRLIITPNTLLHDFVREVKSKVKSDSFNVHFPDCHVFTKMAQFHKGVKAISAIS